MAVIILFELAMLFFSEWKEASLIQRVAVTLIVDQNIFGDQGTRYNSHFKIRRIFLSFVVTRLAVEIVLSLAFCCCSCRGCGRLRGAGWEKAIEAGEGMWECFCRNIYLSQMGYSYMFRGCPQGYFG